ncbi:hypothetical protein CAPTEDRAFT_148469 [Capitella teleta]|uniref:Transmembrane protein 135 N-terminal domain-containing protein n=1 Tax=Capitella teleta TaxID=283909 RepID=R7UBY9_CAPTE|nr:hypothetical protein CAPTEDRAFT_148469 [Capitella teleta]|eukprot:ELU03626.1 hypothetical protein CAPTEDRAFT_148469 [Capitella teleta]
MAALSKLVDCSCYEIGHTWTPSCTRAIYDVGLAGYTESFKIYAPVYIVTALLRRKGLDYYLWRLLPEILQSSLFLGTNASMFIASFCAWRRLSKFYFLTSAFVPALCACYSAIILERKHRRGMLAIYLSNLAMETAFNMASSRGIVPTIPYGEVLLFAVSTSLYMYFFRKKNGLKPGISNGIKFIVGSSEQPKDDVDSISSTSAEPSQNAPDHAVKKQKGLASYLPREVQYAFSWLRQGPKHRLCSHQDSCLASIFQSFVRMFGFGYLVQAGMKLLGALRSAFKNPKLLLSALKHPDNRQLGLFLGLYAALFKLVNCALRWARDKDSPVHGAIGGFVAAWSMLCYRSSSIAMYAASKMVEIIYFKGIDKGHLPFISWGDILLYSVSTAFVFHAAVFEPHNLRPAYWRFLLRLTRNRFGEMNRHILDEFGTKASTLYPKFWPDFDPKFTNLKRPF